MVETGAALLYSFKMGDEKSVSEQIDEFNKIVDDLENIEVTLDDEDRALMLLNSIPLMSISKMP